MEAFQQRVVDEAEQLGDKLSKLGSFVKGQIFDKLPDEDKALMQAQFDHMTGYMSTLQKRIARF